MEFYRRRLPHWQPDGAPIFLTWRLFGSLPRNWDLLREAEGRRFVRIDREMDAALTGPTWLKDPLIAESVANTLLLAERDWKLYDLFAWVVMSNHVHVLLQPHKRLREVTRAVKNTSARKANLILGRSGERFWQPESYDRWVRDSREFDRILGYIEWNPVKAGLVSRPEDWRWSSARLRSAGL